jgi:hypothetical protein
LGNAPKLIKEKLYLSPQTTSCFLSSSLNYQPSHYGSC